MSLRIEVNRLPLSVSLLAAFPGQAVGLALSGGEDYELVLIAPRPVIDGLRRNEACQLAEIGEVVQHEEPRVAIVDEAGREIPMARGGWDHFS